MPSPAAALLGELDALHRNTIFPGNFEKLQWSMVAAYECELSRQGSDIHLHKTTFWVSADKDPRGALTIMFDDSSAALGTPKFWGNHPIRSGFAFLSTTYRRIACRRDRDCHSTVI
jgi:hypothetical protein